MMVLTVSIYVILASIYHEKANDWVITGLNQTHRNIRSYINRTLTEQPEPKPVKKPKPVKGAKPVDFDKFNWRYCKPPEKNISIPDALYDQLKRIVSVFNDTEYIAAYGTLLGIIRDKDINPYEIDNDIIVSKKFRPSYELKMRMIKVGLIIFKHDIYRICDYQSKPYKKNIPPWGKRYVVYTDIYNQLPDIKPFHGKKDVYDKSWHIQQMPLRDIMINTPDNESAKALLHLTYNNYMQYPKKETWKQKILKINV